MTFRSRPLLNMIHECPCMAQFKHNCSEYQGVEPAHSDAQIFGRGHGHKSHDFAVAGVCHTAHLMLDTFEREIKQTEWMRAYVRTWAWLWEHKFIEINKQVRAE